MTAKAKPLTGPRRPKPVAKGRIVVGSTPEYRRWLSALAAHTREPDMADLVRTALRDFATSKGFQKLMPKR